MLDCESYLKQFDPLRDTNGKVCEAADAYAARMQAGILSHWPAEVLKEWLHRHAHCIDLYAPLRFERMRFRPENWPDERIPGREAFLDPTFCDNFSDFLDQAQNDNNWLAVYMATHGTWNTPIVLLESKVRISIGEDLLTRQPLHLLEGNKRLAFLEGLRDQGRQAAKHVVWIVNLEPSDSAV